MREMRQQVSLDKGDV